MQSYLWHCLVLVDCYVIGRNVEVCVCVCVKVVLGEKVRNREAGIELSLAKFVF